MQLVELAKVLLSELRCLILDEPSAVLVPAEAARLWKIIRTLVARDFSVVLITHKIAVVLACADCVEVMRNGRITGGGLLGKDQRLDTEQLVHWMVGQRELRRSDRLALETHAKTRLWIKKLCAGAARDIELELRAGEVLGIAGVSGNGQTSLAEALGGVLPVQMLERQRLERDIIAISEHEQQHFGQELHDGLGQHLTTAAIQAELLARDLQTIGEPQAQACAQNLEAMLGDAVSQTRLLARLTGAC